MNAVGGSNDYVCSQEPKKVLERAKMSWTARDVQSILTCEKHDL